MSIEKARQHLRSWGMEGRIREFSRSSATVALAAEALGCDPARIAKTLSFRVDGRPVLIVAAGDARVDNALFRARFRCKAKMLRAEEAEECIGHAVGGICPFGIKEGVDVYLDESLRRFSTVFPACGSASSAIELSIGELEQCSRSAGWVDVCKDWRESAARSG
ncbi:MAG: YbaK/EbsC family protein [Mailhella sp.]|nr:YbaK/EbsC family protein [Mailhella sp.]MBR5705162.1 YbaK/EbsC family protein [Deltaproteobacteria bacterium]